MLGGKARGGGLSWGFLGVASFESEEYLTVQDISTRHGSRDMGCQHFGLRPCLACNFLQDSGFRWVNHLPNAVSHTKRLSPVASCLGCRSILRIATR